MLTVANHPQVGFTGLRFPFEFLHSSLLMFTDNFFCPDVKGVFSVGKAEAEVFLHILVQGQKLNKYTKFYQNRTIFEK